MLRWRWRRKGEREAARRGAEHDRRCVMVAADQVITRAARAAGQGPVLPTAEEVRAWAAENFLLDVPLGIAARALRKRLRQRGYR